MEGIGLGESIAAIDASIVRHIFEMVYAFAEEEELCHILEDGISIEFWCLRWLENGWRDANGRDMNQGVIYRLDGKPRLLARWQSMLLGYEHGYRVRAEGQSE